MGQLAEAVGWIREFATRLGARRVEGPIDTVDRLSEFLGTRASLIAQKKLYGYLKERIGISYPTMFADEEFALSIRLATVHVFAASLADLTIHGVSTATAQSSLPAETRKALAVHLYREGLAWNAEAIGNHFDLGERAAEFSTRADKVSWDNVAAGAEVFIESPKALLRWAPIADEHKRYDVEVVRNSIRFAWNEVRQELRRRLDARAVVEDWTGRD